MQSQQRTLVSSALIQFTGMMGVIAILAGPADAAEPLRRDPQLQPFSSHSIWNMPIGGDAQYVFAGIGAATGQGMTMDEDIIVLTPSAPLTPVYVNTDDWNLNVYSANPTTFRCASNGTKLADLPLPANFVVNSSQWISSTPNHSSAILMSDGRTLYQTQPFSRCSANQYATSHYVFPQVDLYGQGIQGAHGGSGLSSIGGTIRLGELAPGSVIRHALKVNLYASHYIAYNNDGTSGYRWPAATADGYAANVYGGTVPALEMGALLALLPDFDVNTLQTEPAKIIARALMDYGAYVADDTAWDVYALATEWSPTGRVKTQFKAHWGFDFDAKDLNHPWAQDMRTIFTHLHVVDNNTPMTLGGGGQPRQPVAPALLPPSSYVPLHADFDGNKTADVAGLGSDGSIYYTTNLSTWSRIPATLARLVVGDFNGDGKADLAGLSADGGVYQTTNLSSLTRLPSTLAFRYLVAGGDFNGDRTADLATIGSDGGIYTSTDMGSWIRLTDPAASLVMVVSGDFNGDGKADLAGIDQQGHLHYTLDLSAWTRISGTLSRLVVGDFNGDGKADLAGLGSDWGIYYMTDLANWVRIPGAFTYLAAVGDLNGDRNGDFAVIKSDGSLFYLTNRSSWIKLTGLFSRVVGGDLNGDGKADLVTVSSAGTVSYSTTLKRWTKLSGTVSRLGGETD